MNATRLRIAIRDPWAHSCASRSRYRLVVDGVTTTLARSSHSASDHAKACASRGDVSTAGFPLWRLPVTAVAATARTSVYMGEFPCLLEAPRPQAWVAGEITIRLSTGVGIKILGKALTKIPEPDARSSNRRHECSRPRYARAACAQRVEVGKPRDRMGFGEAK